MPRALPNTFVLKIIILGGDSGENNKDGELRTICFLSKTHV